MPEAMRLCLCANVIFKPVWMPLTPPRLTAHNMMRRFYYALATPVYAHVKISLPSPGLTRLDVGCCR
jgi:hypothetical protein